MNYEVFIEGENITLCIPNDYAINNDGWAQWFNDIQSMQATEHAVFPNYVLSQRERLNNLAADSSKIVLLICDQQAEHAYGVLSLQNIDMRSRIAEVAITMSKKARTELNRFASLEAMGRISQHGIDELGLRKVIAGQAAHLLVKWNKYMELIGFETEGVLRASFVRGHTIADSFSIALHREKLETLQAKRSGSIWPGNEEISRLLKIQPALSHAEKVSQTLQELASQHFSYLYDLSEEEDV